MALQLRYLLLLSAATGALAGGAVATVALSGVQAPNVTSGPQKTAKQTKAEVEAAPVDDTARRLTELERRVAGLQSLQQLLARLRANSDSEDTPEGQPAPAASNVDVADPVFEAAVADIISRDREQREMARQEQRQQRREQRIEQSIARLGTALALQPNQTAGLTNLLRAHWGKLTEIREGPTADANPVEQRAQVDALVKKAEEAILQVLTPEQAARYKTLSKDEKLDVGPRPERRNNTADPRAETAAPR